MRQHQPGHLIGVALAALLLCACGDGGPETTTATRPGRDVPRTVAPREDTDEDTATTVITRPATTVVARPVTTVTAPPLSTVTEPPDEAGDCPAADGSAPTVTSFEEPPPMCIDPARAYAAQIVTNYGSMSVTLDAGAAPVTVNNFVVLARYHYFDGTLCHRIITDFVVQCGDPTATGIGGPGYEFADELPASSDLYVLGSVSMANAGPGTNGSQFFFATSDVTAGNLEPYYSLFGQVTADGLPVLETLNQIGSDDSNGSPPRADVRIETVTILES